MGRALFLHPRGEGEELLQVTKQTAKLLVFARAPVDAAPPQRAGDDALHGRRVVADGIAEQQPTKALAPSVAGGRGHAERGQMLGVDAPGYARALQAAAQRGQVRLVDAEAHLHRPGAQRRQHRAAAVARPGQGENVQERFDGRVVAPPATADIDRNHVRRGEHRLDGRRVVLQGRREDQHIGRLDVRVRIEDREQAVVQHLRFAHRRVADVDLQRVVVLGNVVGRMGVPVGRFVRAAQFEDVLLHHAKPRRDIGIPVDLDGVSNTELVRQQRLHVARRPPPEREQLVALHRRFQGRSALAPFAPRAARRGTFPRRAHVRPELAARAEHVEMHIHQ